MRIIRSTEITIRELHFSSQRDTEWVSSLHLPKTFKMECIINEGSVEKTNKKNCYSSYAIRIFYGVPFTQQPSKWSIIDVKPDNAFKQNSNTNRKFHAIFTAHRISSVCKNQYEHRFFFVSGPELCDSIAFVVLFHSCANIKFKWNVCNANNSKWNVEMWFSGFIPFPCAPFVIATIPHNKDANQYTQTFIGLCNANTIERGHFSWIRICVGAYRLDQCAWTLKMVRIMMNFVNFAVQHKQQMP